MAKRNDRSITPADKKLFESVLDDVQPLKQDSSSTAVGIQGDGQLMDTPVKRGRRETAHRYPDKVRATTPIPLSHFPSGRAPGLDRATAVSLQRGKVSIHERLDLHGMSQLKARETLDAFLKEAYQNERRVLLVITGKGHRSRKGLSDYGKPAIGVLRQKVPVWLSESPMSGQVLAFAPARPEHGGDGAFYVLLKKRGKK
ncbi:MAG: hypothetical protein CMM58_02580 [Rhodospirillaceae bacterium]|nr:hypothetical protein [Rhodospirillaceae bacterium]|tara:strand:+ start:834 stop:1433 length:600 start_codon:yes stop_codon:yes gene_type:complete